MVHALVDPPVKNFDFGYYRVVYSKPSGVIFTVAGYTNQTFGKYNRLDRISAFFQQTEEELNTGLLTNMCENFEIGLVMGAFADESTQEEHKRMLKIIFDNLPNESGQTTLRQCFMIDSNTYDLETPKKRMFNEIDTIFANKRAAQKCRTYMSDYIKIFKKKHNIPDGKISKVEVNMKGGIYKYPGYFSVFEMQRTKMHIEDKNGMIWITCSDSIPDYNNKVRGGVSLVNVELGRKTYDEREKYIENLKKKKIEEQKQEEQENLDTKDKQGL
jgi:hypothetical protein